MAPERVCERKRESEGESERDCVWRAVRECVCAREEGRERVCGGERERERERDKRGNRRDRERPR